MRTWHRGIPPVATVGVVAAVLGGLLGVRQLTGRDDVLDDLPETEDPPAARAPQAVLRAPRRPLPLVSVNEAPGAFERVNHAFAFHFRSEIYEAPAKKPGVVGYARRGTHLAAGKRVHGPGCSGGRWYPVPGGGYVCTRLGYIVGKKRTKPWIRQRVAALGRVLPYRYAKVEVQGSPRLFRAPTATEAKLLERAAAGQAPWPDIVDKRMKGIYFVALDRVEGGTYYRTIRGRYVHKDHIDLRATPPMRGQLLDGKRHELPLAFVYGEDSPIYRVESGRLVKVGRAQKHARFPLARVFEREGRKLVEGPDELVVPRDNVRLVRRITRPERIPARARWIHVDLSEQALVAYEGDTPVFATLVSSGKEGFDPPIGVFRVVSKHVSITMNGPDPDDGWYEVEDVPWTQYYWESYALHGAYWHNDFGKPRSHGCTNLAPADARWLFGWTDPGLPRGWHARLGNGTHVTFTR